MIATSLILLLLLGFIIVEKNTRKIGFADNNPWFIYKDSYDDGHYFKIRFMNKFSIFFSMMLAFLFSVAIFNKCKQLHSG